MGSLLMEYKGKGKCMKSSEGWDTGQWGKTSHIIGIEGCKGQFMFKPHGADTNIGYGSVKM